MAKTMKVAEFKAYFESVLNEYSDTPIAEFFTKEIEEIVEKATKGLRAKNNVERQEAYDEIVMSINNLNNKVDASLNEVVNNFVGNGGKSSLRGTFYYNSNEGDEKENRIVQAAKSSLNATNTKEKFAKFLDTIVLFEEYINDSTLNAALDTTDLLNGKDISKSLTAVYNNSVKAEKYWGYRDTKQPVHELIEDNQEIRSKLAAPFRYYTIAAGLKTGKIKKLTPELINELRWISKSTKNNPIMPKGINLDDPSLKNDINAQTAIINSIANQYSESELKERLIKARTDFSNNPTIMSTKINQIGAFKRGQLNGRRSTILAISGIAVALAMMLSMATQVGSGFEGNIFELVGEYLGQSALNVLLPILVPSVGAIITTRSYNEKTKAFINRYNNLSAQNKNNLLKDIQQLANVKDKKQRQELINKINAKYDNVLGKKKGDIERNVETLIKSIKALQRETKSKVEKPTLKGTEVSTIHNIDNKENIVDHANKLNLSIDGPFAAIVKEALSRLPGYTPNKSPILATGSLDNENITQDPQPVSSNTNEVEVSQEVLTQLDTALNEIKENINELNYGFDVTIGNQEYSIDIQRRGQIANIYDLKKRLEEGLEKIGKIILSGKRTYTLGIDNSPEQAKKMSKTGIGDIIPRKGITRILPSGKKVVPGDDEVTIKVTKKPGNNGR